MNEFKLGDRVIVDEPANPLDGYTGYVVDIDENLPNTVGVYLTHKELDFIPEGVNFYYINKCDLHVFGRNIG